MDTPTNLHPLDVRNWTPEEAVRKLFRSEMTYLVSRGWRTLCGTPDNRYYIAPGDDHKLPATKLYTHEEALSIQKETDKGIVR